MNHNSPGSAKIMKTTTWYESECNMFPATLVVLPDSGFDSKADYEKDALTLFTWLNSLFCTATMLKLRDHMNRVFPK